MTRYKIIIEYIGTHFVGFQKQKNGLAIQEVIETAIYNFSRENVSIFASGRTDTGVHAFGQVAHFDLHKEYDAFAVKKAINHFLKPHLIAIIECEKVSPDFHARFSSIERSYLYRIINRSAPLIIDKNLAWHISEKLDVKKMQEGASFITGTHDFTSFRATQCQAKSPLKTINSINIEQDGVDIKIYVSARSFLHHMVRNIVGVLMLVGVGKWTPKDIQACLIKRDRKHAGMTAPAHGLYFLKADY